MKKALLTAIIATLALTAMAETYEGFVQGKHGGYVLLENAESKTTVANFVWDQTVKDAVAPFEGKFVRVTGTLKPNTGWPTIQAIESIEIIP